MAILQILESSLVASSVVFAVCTLVIGYFGSRLAGVADRLADRTGLGEAIMGGVLLGAVTSLSGSVLSVSAAFAGEPVLALSNAVGGMAAQMVFLVVADFFYRGINLEHAAASVENMLQGVLLVCVLSILLIATFSPDWTLWGVHPGTPVMIGAYVYGMVLVNRAKLQPMWRPEMTQDTKTDVPEDDNQRMSLRSLVTSFVLLGAVLAFAGWAMQQSASTIVRLSGINPAVMGILFTSVATSLPELVTSVAAARRGALTLAVSGILGGNAYDTLFAAFADVAYREGSIYHAMPSNLKFWVSINLLMGGVLIMGLLVRERRGVGKIGFESFVVLSLYLLGCAVLLLGGSQFQ